MSKIKIKVASKMAKDEKMDKVWRDNPFAKSYKLKMDAAEATRRLNKK